MKAIAGTVRQFVPSSIKRPLKRFLYPDWHKGLVGGDWEEIGKLQFDFWLRHGLKPEHYFLDIGCGALRAGIHFVRYLEVGHYFGVDNNKEALNAGQQVELVKHELTHKNPTLVHTNNFNFRSLGVEFDYATAHSVFPHLSLNSSILCIMNLEKVLVPGGKCYATFFENPRGKFNLDPIERAHLTTYFDGPIFHYDFETFKWICEGTSLKVEYMGDWTMEQKMMVFTKI